MLPLPTPNSAFTAPTNEESTFWEKNQIRPKGPNEKCMRRQFLASRIHTWSEIGDKSDTGKVINEESAFDGELRLHLRSVRTNRPRNPFRKGPDLYYFPTV